MQRVGARAAGSTDSCTLPSRAGAALQGQQDVDRLGDRRPGGGRPTEHGRQRQDGGGQRQLHEHRAAQGGHCSAAPSACRRARSSAASSPPAGRSAAGRGERVGGRRGARRPGPADAQPLLHPDPGDPRRGQHDATRTSLATSTQPYVVFTSAAGSATSRTACTGAGHHERDDGGEGQPREARQDAARSSARVVGRSTTDSRATSPPIHTAIAATWTTVTVTARPGHGPATGCPTAAVLPTSPSATSAGGDQPAGVTAARRAPRRAQHQQRAPRRGRRGRAAPEPCLRPQGRRQQRGVEHRPDPGARGVRALEQEVAAAPAATAAAPRPASRRSRSEAQPPGQHSATQDRDADGQREAGEPEPAEHRQGHGHARVGRVAAPPAPVGTSSPSPTTKE